MSRHPRPHPFRRSTRLAALAVAAAWLAACGGAGELAEARDVDTDGTAASEELSVDAEAADRTAPPDADRTELDRVLFDGTPRPVAAVTCEEGPEITAQLEDGGDVQVTSEEDGTTTVRVVVPDDGASLAWAAEDPGAEAVTFLPDAVEGTVTVTPVDVDGAPDRDRDEAELDLVLHCDD